MSVNLRKNLRVGGILENSLTRKESITKTAIEIIDEIGIQGLSIRELAKRQGITEAAIYRHFENKQDIILSVLNFFACSVLNIIKDIEEKNLKPKEGILFFVRSHTEFFEQQRYITSVVFSEEIFRDNYVVATRMQEIFNMRSNYIAGLVEEGQKQGELTHAFTSEEFTDIILGLLRRLTLKWRISAYSFSLKDKVSSILEKLFGVCL